MKNEPGHLAYRSELNKAICLILIANVVFREPPGIPFGPSSKTIVEQPCILTGPQHLMSMLRLVSDAQHADVECVHQLETVLCCVGRALDHLPGLNPFL